MKDWPEQAYKAYQNALRKDDRNEYLLRLNGQDLGYNDQKTLKRIIIKLDLIFCESHFQIEWPKNWDEEKIEDTVFRRWEMFFTSLVYGIDLYCLDSKKQFTSDLEEYKTKLIGASKIAYELADQIRLIKLKRDRLSGRRVVPYYPNDLDAFGWVLGALEVEQKEFCNPVEEIIEEATALLRTTDRYDNGRYWPEPETVLEEFAGRLELSHEAIKNGNNWFSPVIRSGGIPGLIKALAHEPHFNQWTANTNYPFHLPKMFLFNSRFSSGELARLIHIAQGLGLDEKTISPTRTAINKTKLKMKAIIKP